MKKRVEYCARCRKETIHRYKKQSWKRGGKDSSYSTYPLSVKCMTCGYKKGEFIRKRTQKRKHVKV